MEKELIVARKERETAVKEAEQCRNETNSVQVEYEVFQQRSKSREKELIESLQEARSNTSNVRAGDNQKLQLESARKELKQLEVQNYQLQMKLEEQAVELEKFRKVELEQGEKLEQLKKVLDKDIGRKDAQKLFRMVTRLRAIMADEDLLINTNIDTEDLMDSLGDSSMSDCLDRESPAKIVLTNEMGKENVILKNGNSELLDMNIENGELKKKVKLLEEESIKLSDMVKMYQGDIEKWNGRENQVEELTKQLQQEQSKVQNLNESLQSKKKELDKLTAEYDELSTQVIDNIQDIENYKEQIEALNKKLQASSENVTRLNKELEAITKSSTDEVRSLHEKNNAIDVQLKETQKQINKLEEEAETLRPFKPKYEEVTTEIERLGVTSSGYLNELQQLREQHQQLQERHVFLQESKTELEQKLQSLESAQEKHGDLQTHFDEQQQKLKQLQDENCDLTVAVQVLSAKIVSLEEQLVPDDSGTQPAGNGESVIDECTKLKLETSLEMIKEEKNHLLETLPDLELIEAQVKELEQEKELLEQQFSEMQAKYEAEVAKHNTLQVESKGEIEKLQTEIEQLSEHHAALQHAKLKQEEELQTICDKLSSLEEDRSALLKQEESHKEQLQTALMQTESTKKELKAVLEQNKTQEAELQKTLEELTALKEQGALVVEQVESLKEEHLFMVQEKQKADEKCESLCNEISRIMSEKEKASETEIRIVHEERTQLETEISALKEEIEVLKAAHVTVEQEKSKLQSKLQSIESEMEDSSNIREHLDKEVRALKSDLGDLEQQLKENNEKIEHYQKERAEYQRQLNEKTDEVESGNKEQSELNNVIKRLEEKIAAMQQESVDRVSRTEGEWMDKLKAAEALSDEQRIELKALKEEKQTLLERIQEMSRSEGEWMDKLKTAETFNDEQKIKLDALESEKVSLLEQIQVASQEKKICEELISEKDSVLETVTRHVASLENLVSDLRLQAEQTELNRLEVEKMRDDLQQQADSLLKLLEEKESALADKATEVAELCRKTLDLEESFKTLQAELAEKEKRLNSKEEDQSKEREVLKQEINELMKRLEQDINHYERTLTAERERSSELQRQLVHLEEVKVSLAEELEKVQGSHQTLVVNHAELSERFQESAILLEAQITNLQSDLVIRKSKLEEKCAELERSEEQITLLTSETKKLQEALKAEKSRAENLANQEIPSLKSTIEQLEQKLSANAEEASRSIQQLTESYQQEQLIGERLAQQLEEAKHAATLQPDGRPSLGDGKVAQALRKENEDLLKQLNELQKVHVFKTKQLQDKLDEYKQMEVEYGQLKEEMSTMRHESSFQERETQIDELKEKINQYELVCEETSTRHRSLQRQNDELRVRHQNLVMEMDDLRRIADKDRKSRRQSTHDDRRGVSFNTRDSAVMTDPNSTSCNCLEMDALIKELRKQLLIKDCQLNTQKMMASANPLKNDVVELRNRVKDREMEIIKLQDENQSLSLALNNEQKRSDKPCASCVRQQRQRSRSIRSDTAVQTDREAATSNSNEDSALIQELTKKRDESQEELKKLNDKYQQMKRLCRIRNEKIVTLSQDMVEKENESCNANKSVQQEVSQLKRQLKESEDKYLQIQKLYQSKCGMLKAEKTSQTDSIPLADVEILREKYDKYKTMAIALMERNKELERRLVNT